MFWYAGIEEQRRSLQTEPEDPFEAGPVHPSGRAGVPGPSAASDMGRRRIEVGADDVGLDLVAVNRVGRARMVDGVQHREQLAGLVAVAEHGEGDHRPEAPCVYWPPFSRMPGGYPLIYPGSSGVLVEGWGEEQHQAFIAADEVFIDRRHGRAARIGSAAREITLHDCAIESMRHSLFEAEPSGVPSSK